jgi:hypothetical protein
MYPRYLQVHVRKAPVEEPVRQVRVAVGVDGLYKKGEKIPALIIVGAARMVNIKDFKRMAD